MLHCINCCCICVSVALLQLLLQLCECCIASRFCIQCCELLCKILRRSITACCHISVCRALTALCVCLYVMQARVHQPEPVCLSNASTWCFPHTHRVGQNRTYTPYMTVCMVIILLKIPYVHRIYVCIYGSGPPYYVTCSA